jgi:hypothetical protein
MAPAVLAARHEADPSLGVRIPFSALFRTGHLATNKDEPEQSFIRILNVNLYIASLEELHIPRFGKKEE